VVPSHLSADTLIIGLLLPVSNVAHYAIASRLTTFIRNLATKPIDVLVPGLRTLARFERRGTSISALYRKYGFGLGFGHSVFDCFLRVR
jgi:O-antigen/teichoic acid export membrane protein